MDCVGQRGPPAGMGGVRMKAKKKPYVEAMDLVRAATIVSVVAVHSTWYTANGGHWISSGALLSLMHFTREAFMALTGFVLTYSLFGKKLQWKSVWIKRYKLVLFPYMIWSAAYMLIFGTFAGVGAFFLMYGKNLLDGGAWFQLYYLLITMQFYLILPGFLMLMRVAKKHPWWVLGAAVVFQLALMTYDQYGIGPHAGGLNTYMGEEVWTYTLYFVMGGIGAVHWQAIRQWLATHFRTVLTWTAMAAGVMLAEFFLETYLGHNMAMGDAVLQPAMVPWSMMIIVLLSAIGIRYETRRQTQPHYGQLIKRIADLSFGIYLVHPMILEWWAWLLSKFYLYSPSYLLDAITVILLVSISMLGMGLIGKTPFSPWLIGRSALTTTRSERAGSEVVSPRHL